VDASQNLFLKHRTPYLARSPRERPPPSGPLATGMLRSSPRGRVYGVSRGRRPLPRAALRVLCVLEFRPFLALPPGPYITNGRPDPSYSPNIAAKKFCMACQERLSASLL
jgi:hypothetical protein